MNGATRETPFTRVEFPSQGAILRGRLYLRAGQVRRPPVIVMAHGFSATASGMTADRYAEAFYEAGVAVLLYDHRNFGMSDGEPRLEINKWIQARGYCDALTYLEKRGDVDPARMGVWGDSMSAAEVIVVGAIDARVKAIVAQVPACGDHPPPPDPDGSRFASIRDTFLGGDVSGTPETTFGPLPVVSCDQKGTPSLLKALTAYRWFIEHGGRFGSQWQNSATLVAPATPNAVLCAPHLKAPILVVMSPEDEMGGCNPAVTRLAYEASPEPKEMFATEGGHFGVLYWPSKWFDEASHVQREFLLRWLT